MQHFKFFENFNAQIQITDIVIELFKSRDFAHQSHLATDSFAAHKALQEYYEAIVELLDKLVETWQGTCGEKLVYQLNFTPTTENDIDRLSNLGQKINMFSETLSSNFSQIKNILDEILMLINQTIYKLKFLH